MDGGTAGRRLVAACASSWSTAPTSCSATTTACPRTAPPRGPRWGRPGCAGVDAAAARAGRDPLGVATDHVIESFRNDLWAGYKSSAGLDPALIGQFGLVEVRPGGDGGGGLADGRGRGRRRPGHRGRRALPPTAGRAGGHLHPRQGLGRMRPRRPGVQMDRRAPGRPRRGRGGGQVRAARPSIPDYLALVGDSADGYPGLPGWGQVGGGRARPLRHHRAGPRHRPVGGGRPRPPRPGRHPAGAAPPGHALQGPGHPAGRPLLLEDAETLRWTGPTPLFAEVCERIDARPLATRAAQLAAGR